MNMQTSKRWNSKGAKLWHSLLSAICFLPCHTFSSTEIICCCICISSYLFLPSFLPFLPTFWYPNHPFCPPSPGPTSPHSGRCGVSGSGCCWLVCVCGARAGGFVERVFPDWWSLFYPRPNKSDSGDSAKKGSVNSTGSTNHANTLITERRAVPPLTSAPPDTRQALFGRFFHPTRDAAVSFGFSEQGLVVSAPGNPSESCRNVRV